MPTDGRRGNASGAAMGGAPGAAGGMPMNGAPNGVSGAAMRGVPGGAGRAAMSSAGAFGALANAGLSDGGDRVSNTDLALAAGYVVVEAGCRGRDNVGSDGNYYGKAPAAIVDLKAAVAYLHYNDKKMPGDADHIITTGVSAGGALSALLGASGDSSLYKSALNALGAADASDAVYASADYCPITDLENADGLYEYLYGNMTSAAGKIDKSVSNTLAATGAAYIDSLKLRGIDGYGSLTATNYRSYLLKKLLEPSCETYLKSLSAEARAAYLKKNSWITYRASKATFTFDDYLSHVGLRTKTAPAFDTFDLSAAENSLFGTETQSALHFTAYGLANDTSGVTQSAISSDMQTRLDMMNPMSFLTGDGNSGSSVCKYWFIRLGSSDTDTSLCVSQDLAAAAAGTGAEVNDELYWDAGHGANEDPEAFIAWVAKICG
jgi:hypothetical protein